MTEVRTMLEGSLSLVQASASGGLASGARVWATASAPASAVALAYLTNFTYSSARTLNTISNRGLPTHHKNGGATPITVNATVMWTGGDPTTAWKTASGATLPMVHAEFKALDPENGSTGVFFQFHGVALQQMQFTEADDGDNQQMTFMALGMNGPTGSGYLS